jgi:hypothetical protein
VLKTAFRELVVNLHNVFRKIYIKEEGLKGGWKQLRNEGHNYLTINMTIK